MKPKFLSRISTFAPFSRSSLIVFASFGAAGSAFADRTWNGSVDGFWTTTGNWSGGVIPRSTDVAIFNATSAANTATTLGQTFSIRGVKIVDPAAAVSIAAGNTVTLGFSGVDMATATQDLSLSNTLVLDEAQSWTVATGRTLTVNGASSGTALVTKAGPGTLAFTVPLGSTGGAILAGGNTSMALAPFASAFSGGQVEFRNGASLSTALASSNTFGLYSSLFIDGGQSGVFNLNGSNRAEFGSSTGHALNGSGTFTINLNGNNSTRCDIRMATNDFSGEIIVNGSAGAGRGMRLRDNAGDWNGFSNARLTIKGDAYIESTLFTNGGTYGIGTLSGDSATAALFGSNTTGALNWSIGARSEDSIYAGGIRGNAAITKVGSAILSLTNTTLLDYSGATNVNEGVLKINGAKTGTGATTVIEGGQLTGTGSIGGTTTVAAFGLLSPGDDLVAGGIGNITHSSLTLASESVLNLQFGTGNDTVTVASGGTLTLGTGATVDVNGFGTVGSYPIINIAGATVSGVPSSALSVVNGVSGRVYSFTSDGSAIRLVVGTSDPTNYWKVDGNGSWGTAANWSKNTVPNAPSAIAKFGPTVGGNGSTPFSSNVIAELNGDRTIGSLTLNDDFSAISFTIARGSSGSLLMDNGAGASNIVSVTGLNSITAPVVVDAGGLVIDVSNADAGNHSLTVSGVVSGASALLSKSGPGELTLSGVNTYGGGTTFGAGTTRVNSATSLGAVSGAATFSGGILKLDAALAGIGRSYQVSGANSAVIDTNGFDFGYTGVISPLAGGTGGLTKRGLGTMTLTAAQTYTGSTSVGVIDTGVPVGGGTLELTGSAAINGAAVNVISGSTLDINGGSVTAGALSSLTTNTGSLAGSHLNLSAGSAAFNAGLNVNVGNPSTNASLSLTGGTFSASFVSLGRCAPILTNPALGATTTSGFYINGATANITGALFIGAGTLNSTASARIDSGSLTVGGPVSISINSPDRWSILDINGGTFASTDAVTGVQIGSGQTGSDAFLVRGTGEATVERFLLQQPALSTETSLISLTEGTLYVGSGGIVGNNNGGTGILDVQIGTATLGAKAPWTTLLGLTLNGSAIIKAADSANVAHDISISGVVGGAGDLNKTGAGALTLAGANTYTGTTEVAAGSLFVTGDSSLATGAVTVASTATLGGNGNIGGNVTIQSGGHQALAVAATSGAQITRVISGTLALNSGNILDLTAAAPPVAGNYTLLTAASITGTPTTVNYNGFTGTVAVVGGNSLVLTVTGGSDFDSWINGFTFAPGANKTATGDPDGDGLTNKQEYAFGLAPNSGASVNPITAQLGKTTGLFTYTRRKPSLTGLGYTYQYSTNLATWTSFTPDSATSNDGNPVEAVTVDVPNALLGNSGLFVRVLAN